MNKKDYIDALDEIKVSEELKKKTIYKVKEEKTNIRIPYKLVNAMAVILILFSVIALSNKEKMNEIVIPTIPETEKSTKTLPTVDNLQNLFTLIKGSDLERYYNTEESSISFDREDSIAMVEKTTLDYSKTNVQESGVDEADIVKTDGKYIYYLSDQKLIAISTSENRKVTEIIYPSEDNFYPSELYLYNNKLVVIGQVSKYNPSRTICYDIAYHSNSTTKIIVYDLTNKNELKVDRELELDGNTLNTRMIGEYVYIITNQYIYTNVNEEEINEDDYKPTIKDSANVNEPCKKIEFSDIKYFEGSEQSNYLNVMAFNVNTKREAIVETFLGAGNNVYASENNIYITRTVWNQDKNQDQNNTEIIKLKIDKMNVEYIAKTQVKGNTKNQFSINEYKGYLRIATTTIVYNTKTYAQEKLENNLYILNEKLEQVGKLENLAENESIRSVRYLNDKAYIVTFEQTDPLFVISTKDPRNPQVLGELKLPGYSEYLQFWDEKHIIGIGYDTELKTTGNGTQANITGMKMTLFDISDSTNPIEVSSIKIGNKGTYSEVLYNHKALLLSKAENIISFPVRIDEGTKTTFQGAVVYTVDVNKGFTEKGRIGHVEKDTKQEDRYQKYVERIIYIGDNFYTLSPKLIKVTNRNTMQSISNIEL